MDGAKTAGAAIPMDRAIALYSEAQALWRGGDARAAADRLDEALKQRPNFAEALAFGGFLIERNGKLETAVRFYARALELKADMPVVWGNLGKALFRLRLFAEALEAFDNGLRQKMRDADLTNGRAAALRELGRLEDSAEAARRALALDGSSAEAALNLGNALHKLGRAEEALAAYARAQALKASYADALCGSALAKRALGRLDEARADFLAAEALGCREAISGRGCLDLMLGDFASGWEGYEARWIAGKSLSEALGARFPPWRGPGVAGERVLVLNDHGAGDTIQFCRYLPMMREAGADVSFVAPRRLHRLLASKLQVRLLDAVPENETFDAQVAVSSLPRAFRTRLDSVPAEVPYLAAAPERIARWRERIGSEGFRIGVVWRGNPDPAADRARSFALSELAPLAGVEGIRLISLQVGPDADAASTFALQRLGPDFDAGSDGFIDAAAAMMSVDLIVCCDTSIAHLAGALARPVWVALKFDAEWRWMRGRADSPWYPTARLFRQAKAGDWAGVFQAMAVEIGRRDQPRTA